MEAENEQKCLRGVDYDAMAMEESEVPPARTAGR